MARMRGWLRNLIGQSIKAKRISRSRQPGGAIVHRVHCTLMAGINGRREHRPAQLWWGLA